MSDRTTDSRVTSSDANRCIPGFAITTFKRQVSLDLDIW